MMKFAHLAPSAIEQEIAFLQDRGLLFEEDGRFMSLVLPGKPSASSPTVHEKRESDQHAEAIASI